MTGAMIVLSLSLAVGPALADDRPARDLKVSDLSGALHEAEEKAKELQLPANDQPDDCGCREAAEKLMEKFNAPDHQAMLRDEQQRLQETIFKDLLAEAMPRHDQRSAPETDSSENRLYLFVSSSVPLTTLRNYAAMIDRARAGEIVMVLRGLVGGMKKIRPTMEFIGAVLKKDPTCDLAKEKCASRQVNIQVDPELFQRLRIQEVPALAYLPVSGSDAGEMEAEPIIVSGDAGLDYLLERINREVKDADLDRLIAALRGGILAGE